MLGTSQSGIGVTSRLDGAGLLQARQTPNLTGPAGENGMPGRNGP